MENLRDPIKIIERAAYQLKLLYLVLEVGGKVFADTLVTLYSRDEPMEESFLKVAQIKSSDFNSDQKTFLEKVHRGEEKFRNMDFTLSFKLIQLTCGLEPVKAVVWGERCPEDKRNCLEYLLHRYKSWRNTLIHQFRCIEINSNEDFNKMKETNMEHLFSIVDRVCEKAHITEVDKEEWKARIEAESNMFCEHIVTKPLDSAMTSLSINEPNVNVVKLQAEALPDENIKETNIPSKTMGLFPLRLVVTLTPQEKEKLIKVFGDALFKKISQTATEMGAFNWRTKPIEKSNRLYWIRRIITTGTHDLMETVKIWEEYEEYLN